MNIDTQYMEDTEMQSTIPAGYELRESECKGAAQMPEGFAIAVMVVVALLSLGCAGVIHFASMVLK